MNAYRQFEVKPLLRPVLCYHQLNFKEHISRGFIAFNGIKSYSRHTHLWINSLTDVDPERSRCVSLMATTLHLKCLTAKHLNSGRICPCSLLWRHDGCDGVSHHQRLDCLPSRLFRFRSKKHQSSASLGFVSGIHRRPVNSPHKGPATLKMFPFDDVIMLNMTVFQSIRIPITQIRQSRNRVTLIIDVEIIVIYPGYT